MMKDPKEIKEMSNEELELIAGGVAVEAVPFTSDEGIPAYKLTIPNSSGSASHLDCPASRLDALMKKHPDWDIHIKK